jgi:hypothetical protein
MQARGSRGAAAEVRRESRADRDVYLIMAMAAHMALETDTITSPAGIDAAPPGNAKDGCAAVAGSGGLSQRR